MKQRIQDIVQEKELQGTFIEEILLTFSERNNLPQTGTPHPEEEVIGKLNELEETFHLLSLKYKERIEKTNKALSHKDEMLELTPEAKSKLQEELSMSILKARISKELLWASIKERLFTEFTSLPKGTKTRIVPNTTLISHRLSQDKTTK